MDRNRHCNWICIYFGFRELLSVWAVCAKHHPESDETKRHGKTTCNRRCKSQWLVKWKMSHLRVAGPHRRHERKWMEIAETHHCMRLSATAANVHIDSFHLISLDGRRWGVATQKRTTNVAKAKPKTRSQLIATIIFTKLRFASVFGDGPLSNPIIMS